MEMVKTSAIISPCGRYRYRLERQWDEGIKCTFIMLNPSTADAEKDDPTIRRCIGFAKSWGFAGLVVGNIFAFRATRPPELKLVDDPIGPKNHMHLRQIAEDSRVGICVAAWGGGGRHGRRGQVVRSLFGSWNVDLHYLRISKRGEPDHPLYLKGDLKPTKWTA